MEDATATVRSCCATIGVMGRLVVELRTGLLADCGGAHNHRGYDHWWGNHWRGRRRGGDARAIGVLAEPMPERTSIGLIGVSVLWWGQTLYRIHGTNQPSTIGTFVSSGCIWLTNDDVTDLYGRVQVGTRVVVLPPHPPIKLRDPAYIRTAFAIHGSDLPTK